MKLITLNISKPVSKGRICSYLSKNLLLDPTIVYLLKNIENVVTSGSREDYQAKLKIKRARGSRRWGPHYPSSFSDQLRRCLRGMVSFKSRRGKAAYKRFFTVGTSETITKVLLKQGIKVKQSIQEDFTGPISKYPPSKYVESRK